MVQKLQLADTSLDALVLYNGFYFDGTTYYAVMVNTSTKWITLYTSTDLTNWTSKVSAVAEGTLLVNMVVWYLDSTTLYLAASQTADISTANIVGEINTTTLVFTERTFSADLFFEIFKLGADIWLASSSASGNFCKWNTVTSATDVGFFMSGGGYVDSGYYYFISHDSSPLPNGHFDIRKWDGITFSAVSSNNLGLSVGSAVGFSNLKKVGDAEYLGMTGGVLIQTSLYSWKETIQTPAGSSIFSLYWNDASLEVKYIFLRNFALKISHNGFWTQIYTTQSITSQAAWDNYVIDTSGNIYQLTQVSVELSECKIASKPYTPPDAKIIHTVEPATNEYLVLYDDSNNQIYEGFVESYESKQQGVFTYIMRSPVEQDLSKKITCDRPSEDSHVRLKYFIDTYADFLWYDAGIIDVSLSALAAEHYENKTLMEIIKGIDKAENKQTSIRPTLEVYRDGYTDSGVSVTEGTDMPVGAVSYLKKPLKLSIVKLNGGYVNGVRITSTAYGEANYGYYEDMLSHITDQTQLDAIAAAIVANKNIVLITLQFEVPSQGQFNYGTYITVTSDTYSITADTYYILGTLYDAVSDICTLVCTSALYLTDTKTSVITGSEAAMQNMIYDLEHQIDDLYNAVGRIANAQQITNEPTGFNGRSGSAFTLTDAGPRVLEVTVVSGSYDIYFSGVKHNITATKSLTWADTEGLHAVYFDTDDTLKEIVNPTTANYLTLMTTKCLVCLFYWDATNNVSIVPTEERHGLEMDGYTHYYLHYTRKLQFINGFDLGNFVIGDGSLDTHAQFSIAAGSVADEDIGLTSSAINVGTGGSILYVSGANAEWRKTTQAGFWVKKSGSGTDRLYYNQYTGGAWQLTEVGEGNYVLCHLYLISGKLEQVFAIMGRAEYATLPAAQTGALTEILAIQVSTLPAAELLPYATLIFQTDKDYGNTINARIVAVEVGGDNYISWIINPVTQGAAFVSQVTQTITDGVTTTAPSENAVYDALALKSPIDSPTFTGTVTVTSADILTKTLGMVQLKPIEELCTNNIDSSGFVALADNDTDIAYFSCMIPPEIKTGATDATLTMLVYNDKDIGTPLTIQFQNMVLMRYPKSAVNVYLNNWNGEAGDTWTFTATLDGSPTVVIEHQTVLANITLAAYDLIKLNFKRKGSADSWGATCYVAFYMTFTRSL